MTRKKRGWDSYLPILLVLYKNDVHADGQGFCLLASWKKDFLFCSLGFFILSLLLIPSIFFLFYFLLASLCFFSPLSLHLCCVFLFSSLSFLVQWSLFIVPCRGKIALFIHGWRFTYIETSTSVIQGNIAVIIAEIIFHK